MYKFFFLVGVLGCDSNSDLKYNEASSEQENGDNLSGEVEISADQIELEVEDFETTVSSTLTVSSIGENPLLISRIDITNSGEGLFYVEEELDVELAVDSSLDVLIIASGLQEELTEPRWGELRVRSNDGSNPDIRVPLCAYPSGSSCQ